MYTKQNISRDKASLVNHLQNAGVRVTRQRVQLATILFDGKPKHVTAEQVRGLLKKGHATVSLATIYNTLHQFTTVGLLREIFVDSVTYFDTNNVSHYHFFDEDTRELTDIHADKISLNSLARLPKGRKLSQVDLMLRVRCN
jgi:Fur family iron response transcriptional regulator